MALRPLNLLVTLVTLARALANSAPTSSDPRGYHVQYVSTVETLANALAVQHQNFNAAARAEFFAIAIPAESRALLAHAHRHCPHCWQSLQDTTIGELLDGVKAS